MQNVVRVKEVLFRVVEVLTAERKAIKKIFVL